jgi:hypothetical protein
MVLNEKILFRKKVRSLKEKLTLIEPFPVLYSGCSPAFLQYSRIINGTYPIPMTEQPGSIAGLAKRELGMQFAEKNLQQWQRYSLGRALGFSAEQIHVMHKDIEKYFKITQRDLGSKNETFEEEVKFKKERLEYEKAGEEFEKMFPGEKARYFFAVKLELNSRGNAYDIRVLSQPYKPFLLTDPITQQDMEKLFDHLMSLPGEKSKKMMLEAAA